MNNTPSTKAVDRANRNHVDNVITAQHLVNAAADIKTTSAQWLSKFNGADDILDVEFYMARIAKHMAEDRRFADAAEQIEAIDINDVVELDRTIRRIRRTALRVLTHSDIATVDRHDFAAAQSLYLATAIEL